ncbi:hypothetical protein GALMADRAFT_240488 [Galerina marginata CBS 339.88]|uniref:F-box domain-containing protein n=1 Tax=Galerina marginata (strain CBS 339.88) TaxID=685588 RepID=A0A067TSV1_GALM3|nr:hypothetical protein GALMADRAFT_240488 [Galerina marginata CBS 339.88]
MPKFRAVDIGYENPLLRMEEARVIAALSSVKRKISGHAPIASLPPELLEEIFHICVSWLYGCLTPKHRLAYTQVCSSWRRISLNSSRLWQRIDLCDSRLADEFLLRSKQAPLSIVSASPRNLTTDNLTMHASRLRSIDVVLFPDAMVHLFSIMAPNLSSLASLSLKVSPVLSTVDLDISVPLVRRLFLDTVAIRWQDCQKLTHLSLRGITPQLCPSLSQLYDMFKRSPLLEYVRLENLMPSLESFEASSRPLIPLLHLKEMVISGQQSIVSALLSGISLATHTRLRLYLSLSEDLRSLLPRGLPYATNHRSTSISTVRLSLNGTHFLRPGVPAWSDDPDHTLFSISSALPVSTRVCSSLDHLLDLSRIIKLELNTGVLQGIPMDDLRALFASLVNLETLCTAFNDLEDLWVVLNAIDTERATSRLYAPRLVRLSFSKPADLWWHFTDRWMSFVLSFVQARLLHSVPLQGIEFLRCHGVSIESTQELRALVPQVIVSDRIGTKSCF